MNKPLLKSQNEPKGRLLSPKKLWLQGLKQGSVFANEFNKYFTNFLLVWIGNRIRPAVTTGKATQRSNSGQIRMVKVWVMKKGHHSETLNRSQHHISCENGFHCGF